MTLQEREARACAIIDSMAQELRAVSLYLHDNPELGLNEHKAVKAIHQFLEKQNFISQVGLTDIRELQTALRADYRGCLLYTSGLSLSLITYVLLLKFVIGLWLCTQVNVLSLLQ